MERADVVRWLAEYVEAWRTLDRDRIIALFTEDARYRYRPADDEIVGAAAIADSWIEDPDEPGGIEAAYEPFAIEGQNAVVVGSSTYKHPNGSVRTIFDNSFALSFAEDGRCSEFTEWFMERRPEPPADLIR